MDGESKNLQNDFFNEARKSRTNVTVFLSNGKKLTGRIKSFDKFTLLLEGHQGELMIFKHAVSTITTARWSSDGPSESDRRPAPPSARPGGRRES
jgi:host factor-I protein